MQPQTTPLLDDDTARHLRITRVLLERAYDDLERLELDVPAELRGDVEATSMFVALALEELPAN